MVGVETIGEELAYIEELIAATEEAVGLVDPGALVDIEEIPSELVVGRMLVDVEFCSDSV